jgi:hypothetical protein
MDIGGGAAKNIPLGYPTCFLECAAVKNIIQYIHHDTVVDSARDRDPLKKGETDGMCPKTSKSLHCIYILI